MRKRCRIALATVALFAAAPAAAATPVPGAHCQAGDSPETGLQGQVPVADRESGRAAKGYWCNLKILGSYIEPNRVDVTHGVVGAWATLDSYEHCAYYGDSSVGLSPESSGGGGGALPSRSRPPPPPPPARLTTTGAQAA